MGAAKQLSARISALVREKFERDEKKGIVRPPKLMIAGVPNTGKSTVINALSGEKRAVTGDKAGVTRGKQWIRCAGFELLDTPGTMPPSFENQTLARHLAYIGSINDDILDMDDVALELLREIAQTYPQFLTERYKIEDFSSPLAMYEQVCRSRGFLLKGGDYDYERGAKAIIDDFRKGAARAHFFGERRGVRGVHPLDRCEERFWRCDRCRCAAQCGENSQGRATVKAF